MEETSTPASPSRIALALQERARLTPDRLAAWDIQRSLTYADLDARVSALALRMAERREDLGPAGILPILVAHDLGSLVALHAAIRAGIAFAPLDAGLPAAALASILHRLDDPRVVVAAGPAALPADVDVIDRLLAGEGSIDPAQVAPDAPARVIFTSGSTGEPKGVVSSWRSIDGVVDDPVLAPPPGLADPRAAVMAPMSFAAGVMSAIRPALGTAVVVLDPNAHDPVDLVDRMDRDRLTTIAVVPSHIPAVLDRWTSGRRLEAVRSMMTFGEALEWSMVPVMRRLIPESAVVVNVYGASEGGINFALAITSDTPLGSGRVPLGRPISPNVVRLDPIAADGDDLLEVVARGPRVAMGYWRDPELTARAFGVDADGVRFWRSGDLVRLDGTGLAHFVGRRDNVVKINGKLVEPSEPERILGEVDGIRRAVVLVQEAPRGGQRLVAHVEVEADSPVTAGETRAALTEQVAPHLVPAAIVRHDRLPLTDRGKVDRQALVRAPVEPWRDRGSERSPEAFEVAALDVVAGILGYRGIGPDDDLWEAGLDSLGATELLSTLQDFGWPAMPETILLENRTVSALNQLRPGFVPPADALWLNSEAEGEPVVCVLPPAGDALTFRMLAQAIGPSRPVGIVRQFDPSSTSTPLRTVPQIAASVRAETAAFVDGRAHTVVGYSGSGVVAYEYARQAAERGVECRVVLLDSPAGAATIEAMAVDRTAAPLPRRLRRAARQAWLRALPPMSMPQRERAYALYEIAGDAMAAYRPTSSSVAVTLFVARDGGLAGLDADWERFAGKLDVVHLDCDHFQILGPPHVDVVARAIRGEDLAAAG